MSVSESSINYFLRQYAANWMSLEKGYAKDELAGWTEWLESDSTDEYCFNVAFRELCESRQQERRFHPTNDRPRLVEMKAAYKNIVEREIAKGRQELAEKDCDFCDNLGIRYVVVHTDGITRKSEHIITELPSSFRRFCYSFIVHCTCPRGTDMMEAQIEKRKPRTRLTSERRMSLLNRSFKYADACALVRAYNHTINPNRSAQVITLKCTCCRYEFRPNKDGGECPKCDKVYTKNEATVHGFSRWINYVRKRILDGDTEALKLDKIDETE